MQEEVDEFFGVYGACTEIDAFSEFNVALAASQFPHVPADTMVKVTITDPVSHMANVSVVMTYTDG